MNKITPLIKPLLVTLAILLLGVWLSMYLKDDVMQYVLMHPVVGVMAFVGLAALAVVFPSFTNMMFIPIGVSMFGPLYAALLCILGWWLGSVISFTIGRYYNEYLLERFPSFKNYLYIDKLVGDKNMFWKLILLRMTIPVDVLSYALALFSKRVSYKMNAVTTLIGITPFAFIFAYAGEMIYKNVIWVTSTLAVVFVAYLLITLRKKK
jgi:uncharacterized membrane protein YdjX (TVP38/TMEM64 family)